MMKDGEKVVNLNNLEENKILRKNNLLTKSLLTLMCSTVTSNIAYSSLLTLKHNLKR